MFRAAILPKLGAPEVLTPPLSSAQGTILHGGSLVFVSDGGLYRAALEAFEAELIAAEPLFEPVHAGSWIAARRSAQGGAPSHPDAIVLLPDDPARPRVVVPGQGLGIDPGHTAAVIASLDDGSIRRVDLASGEVAATSARLGGSMDPMMSPPIAVSPGGRQILVMETDGERGPASLVLHDLGSGDRKIMVGPIPAPSWVLGMFTPAGDVLVQVMRLGDSPRYTLSRLPKSGVLATLVDLAVAQPQSLPAFVTPDVVALPLSLVAHPIATYGPVDLVLVPLSGSAQIPVTKTGDVRGRARATSTALLVEGGSVLISVPRR